MGTSCGTLPHIFPSAISWPGIPGALIECTSIMTSEVDRQCGRSGMQTSSRLRTVRVSSKHRMCTVHTCGRNCTVSLIPRPHPLMRRNGRCAWAGAQDYCTVCSISVGMATTLIIPTFHFTLMDSIQNFYGMMTYKHEVNIHLHKELW